jgi:hypothetical protein
VPTFECDHRHESRAVNQGDGPHGSQLTTLTASDIKRFERDCYVMVRQAFSPADGLAMERQ